MNKRSINKSIDLTRTKNAVQVQLTLTKSIGLLVLVGVLLSTAAPADAKQQIVAVEGAAFNTGASLADNLRAFQGKSVSLTLTSGHKITGRVKLVRGSGIEVIAFVPSLDVHYKQPNPTEDAGSVSEPTLPLCHFCLTVYT